MLLRAIRPFSSHERVRHIVVALSQPYATHPPKWLADVVGERLVLVPGGKTRAHSVKAALDALAPECCVVLVHDAARPFVTREIIDSIIGRVDAGVCAIAAVSVSDTIKRSEPDGYRVVETVDRATLWRALTPQGFPRDVLAKAYDGSGNSLERFTDDAALVEAAGFEVHLVPDDPSNIKLTTTQDFVMAEAISGG